MNVFYELRNYSATAEVAAALISAHRRGLISARMDDFDARRHLRWWRRDDGILYATDPTMVEPGARRVEVEWEDGAGWRAVNE